MNPASAVSANSIRRLVMRTCDSLVLGLSFWLATRLAAALQPVFRPGGSLHSHMIDRLLVPAGDGVTMGVPVTGLLWIFATMCPAIVIAFQMFGAYRPIREQTTRSIALASVHAPIAGLGVLTVLMFALKRPAYSRLLVFLFALIGALLLAAGRYAALAAYRERVRNGFMSREVALIGGSNVLERLKSTFTSEPDAQYSLTGYFSTSNSYDTDLEARMRVPQLGTVHQLGDVLINTPIEAVAIALPVDGAPWLDNVLRACEYFRVTTFVVPEILLQSRFSDLKPVAVPAPVNCPLVRLDPVHLDSQLVLVKRLMDLCISSALLCLLSPILLLIALAIKLTAPRLPVFYAWRVVGYKGRQFTGYKFRTMVANADSRKAELMSRNEMSGPVFKIANDPRVTPVGRFLRKYSLDELPQLWSVLKGDMSLVGPRPAIPSELARYELWHKRKLSVMPGITCFWQVRGRNQISNFDEWVRMDLEYIEKWSLWLDCKLIARTAWVVLAGTGA